MEVRREWVWEGEKGAKVETMGNWGDRETAAVAKSVAGG